MFDILFIIFWAVVDLLRDMVRAYEGAIVAIAAVTIGVLYYAWARIRRRQALLARDGNRSRER